MGGRPGSGGGLSVVLKRSLQERRKDPLLAIARLLLGIIMAIFVVGAVVIAGAVPVVYFLRDKVLAHFAAQGVPPASIWAVIAVLLLAVLAAVLGFYYFRHIHRIIDTVGEGDPFVPANAQRLNAMGWIAVAGQLMAIPFNIVGRWMGTVANSFQVDFGLSIGGILLILILFILARVFREGARMREELEGTV